MAKGKKTGGGSRKGVPNRATADVRAAIAMVASETAPKLSAWLAEIEDPAKRLDVFIKLIEYHIPKLSRAELTGQDGGPLQVNIVDPTRRPHGPAE